MLRQLFFLKKKEESGTPSYGYAISDISNSGDIGGWSASGLVDYLYECIDEATASDTDYISSQMRFFSSDVCVFGLTSLTDPSKSTGHKISWRSRCLNGSTTESVTVALLQGSTVLCSRPATVSTSWLTETYTLTSTEADSITDYTDLRVRFTVTSNAYQTIQVSWFRLEIPG